MKRGCGIKKSFSYMVGTNCGRDVSEAANEHGRQTERRELQEEVQLLKTSRRRSWNGSPASDE